MYKWLPAGIVGGAIVLAILNLLAFQGFWYWRFWWFDLVMHLIGGVVLSLFVLWLYATYDPDGMNRSPMVMIFALAFSSIILFGLFWELFEFTSDSANRFALVPKEIYALQTGVVDTLTDLLSDVLGSIFGSLIFLNLWQKRK